jgi:hypothetical protein
MKYTIFARIVRWQSISAHKCPCGIPHTVQNGFARRASHLISSKKVGGLPTRFVPGDFSGPCTLPFFRARTVPSLGTHFIFPWLLLRCHPPTAAPCSSCSHSATCLDISVYTALLPTYITPFGKLTALLRTKPTCHFLVSSEPLYRQCPRSHWLCRSSFLAYMKSGLLFDPENGTDAFLRNVWKLIPNCLAL